MSSTEDWEDVEFSVTSSCFLCTSLCAKSSCDHGQQGLLATDSLRIDDDSN